MVSKHVKVAVFPHFEFGLHLVSLTLTYIFKSIYQFCLLLLVTDVLFLMDNLVAFLRSFTNLNIVSKHVKTLVYHTCFEF